MGTSGCNTLKLKSRRLRAVNVRENTHSDQASQAAAGRLIPPTPRLCFFVRAGTTPLYSTTVSQALRGGVLSDTRGLRGEEGGIATALYWCKPAGINPLIKPPRSLATLLHAPQLQSCAPLAVHTPPPALPLQRNALAPLRLPHWSLIHRMDRRPDHPLCSKPEWRDGGDAGVSGLDGIRGASRSLELKGCARRRRAGRMGLGCL